MDRNALVDKINQSLSENFEISPEKLTPDALLFDDLGLDSLDAVDMLVHIEDELGARVNIDSFKDIRTLGDIHETIYKLIKEDPDHKKSDTSATA